YYFDEDEVKVISVNGVEEERNFFSFSKSDFDLLAKYTHYFIHRGKLVILKEYSKADQEVLLEKNIVLFEMQSKFIRERAYVNDTFDFLIIMHPDNKMLFLDPRKGKVSEVKVEFYGLPKVLERNNMELTCIEHLNECKIVGVYSGLITVLSRKYLATSSILFSGIGVLFSYIFSMQA
ncbi:hypothetical protein PMAYCL1PPCAC_12998, partial [Pristionchus mayeri]